MFASICSLPPDELYQKAIAFKELSDYDNYVVHMMMAANLNHELAIENLHTDYTNERLHDKQDYSKTIHFYEISSKYAFSANYLGWMFCNGLGVAQDYNKSIELYQMAIEKDNSFAMNNLGTMYENGKGVSQNYDKAIKLYKMAIEKGNTTAMTNLAFMYSSGKGIQDYDEAIKLYRMAIEKGNPFAMNNLATMYENGQGIQQNYDQAIKLYQMAIEKGVALAMYYLANMYENGKGVKQDYDLMKKYYLMAIEKGYQNATTNLKNYYWRTQSDLSIIELYDNKFFHSAAKDIINTMFQKNHDLPQIYKQQFANLRFDSDILIVVQTKQIILKTTNIWPTNYDREYLLHFEELLSIASSDNKPFCKDIILHIAGCLFV